MRPTCSLLFSFCWWVPLLGWTATPPCNLPAPGPTEARLAALQLDDASLSPDVRLALAEEAIAEAATCTVDLALLPELWAEAHYLPQYAALAKRFRVGLAVPYTDSADGSISALRLFDRFGEGVPHTSS